MLRRLSLILLLALAIAAPARAEKKALFDNAHAEQAGNADWVIDNDQPIPSPAQSGIGANTAGTFWTGAISSYGVDLVKRGYTVHTNTGTITYGSGTNAYDLSNYDVFIVPEPNTLFTAAEATAILAFVQNGGGLIAISDHSGADRNNDGYDSPMIWNALDPTHLLGVHFGVSADANNNIVQTSTNVATSTADSITHGPVGVVTGLAFHNGTTMTLYPAVNATVRGEVWMSSVAQTSTTGVMAAASQYGNGRVFFIGDSSPVDDGSANSGNSNIYDGWGESGATDSTLFLNATLWATRRDAGDVTAPTVALGSPDGGETWKAGSTHAITWTASDAVGVTSVSLAYSTNGGASFGNSIATGLANSGTYNWTVPTLNTTTARVRVIAYDAAGNAGRDSSAANFTVDQWAITASAGTGGSISPSGTVLVTQGASQAFHIAPTAGYTLSGLAVDGGAVTVDTVYTFTNVTAAHTIAASFTLQDFALVVSIVGSGTVSKSPDLTVYPYGSSVTLDPTAASGWAFVGWSGDTTGTADPLTLLMRGGRAITATFADVTAPVVTLTSPTGGESWETSSVQAVTWAASDNVGVDSVTVGYSVTSATGPWVVVGHGLANTGTLDWTLPELTADSAWVRVQAYDAAGNVGIATSAGALRIISGSTAVGEGGAGSLALARPAPNPSRGWTVLRFTLPQAGHTRLEIVDVSGRTLWTEEGEREAGTHSVRWDGGGTREVGAGLYFVRLTTPWGARAQRLVRLR